VTITYDGADVLICAIPQRTADGFRDSGYYAFIACTERAERRLDAYSVKHCTDRLRTVFGLTFYGTREEFMPVLANYCLTYYDGHL
jgi:hypothetical protein